METSLGRAAGAHHPMAFGPGGGVLQLEQAEVPTATSREAIRHDRLRHTRKCQKVFETVLLYVCQKVS